MKARREKDPVLENRVRVFLDSKLDSRLKRPEICYSAFRTRGLVLTVWANRMPSILFTHFLLSKSFVVELDPHGAIYVTGAK